ncbi:MAG TPA: DUF3786 domain-containing protein [Dehalococcoidia bacterium]|jgi:hypothetical protein|nr:DUF3786 domain-containing protein [Dehalococcoidia bacterium]
MEKRTLTLPNSQKDDYGYELAFRLAREELAQIDDIEEQCRRSGAQYQEAQKAAVIAYLNQPYLLTIPDGTISFMDKGEEVPLPDKILLLHYFTQAKGTPLSGKLISFKELPEGAGYFPTFYKRAVKPLVSSFGSEPHHLVEMAKLLGGREAEFGDAAATLNALPRVPLTLVLWRGDEEFPPEGNIMFDRTICDYLPTEDIIYLCQSAAWKLVKLLKSRR